MGKVVTIDGPAASGKSSVSRELARRLNFNWVSTGAFYRGLAYVAQQMGTNLEDEKALAELAQSEEWGVRLTPEQTEVVFRNKIVTDEIAQESVGSIASKISHFPLLRQNLLKNQRDCQRGDKGLVAEGRDCGTVVFPQAQAKVYLTARSEDRAARRARELGLAIDDLVKEQQLRDQQDSTRKQAPLTIPENAYVVDTTDLTLDQVVELVEVYVRPRLS